LRVVDKPNNEQQVILEAIEPSKDNCSEEKRKRVHETIVAFAKSVPALEAARKQASPSAAAPAPPPPTPAAAKDAPKK
jgi:hypothetical protein